jgi:hypothetical protein
MSKTKSKKGAPVGAKSGSEASVGLMDKPEDLFIELAVEHARRNGFEFTNQCLNRYLRLLVRKGMRVLSRADESEYNQMMRKAKADLIKFVDLMIVEAEKRGATELGESSFADAKSVICPFPPYCRR